MESTVSSQPSSATVAIRTADQEDGVGCGLNTAATEKSFIVSPITSTEIFKTDTSRECFSCKKRLEEYVSKAYELLCREEARISRGLAVNSLSGELIAMYEGMAQITRDICKSSHALASKLSVVASSSISTIGVRELCALMHKRISMVRELMLRGERITHLTFCEAGLPPQILRSNSLDLSNALVQDQLFAKRNTSTWTESFCDKNP